MATARYKTLATPVHEPLCRPVENYAHVEIRELREGETVFDEPPRDRSRRKSKILKLEYRQNLLHNLEIEIDPV